MTAKFPTYKLRVQASPGGILEDKFTVVVKEHFSGAKNKYTGLTLTFKEETASITGALAFEATYNDVWIADTYDVEIIFFSDYPDTPPNAKETGGKIPADFHKYPDGDLCLAAPLEIRKQFNRRPDLLGFIEHLLVPYLSSYSHKLKYYYLPYGELSHGGVGIAESYRELLDSYKIKFDVSLDMEVMKLLKILAEDNYRGHLDCPCGGPSNLRKCHGSALLELKKQQTPMYFFEEYLNLLFYLFPKVKGTPRELISKRLLADLVMR